MNNKEFIAELSERMGYTAKDTQHLVNNIINAMGDAGIFEAKKKLERIIVNPATQQRMLVPPKLVLNFKPNQTWKDKLKGGSK